ncbi:lipoxygenase [Hydrocoleum sp. CS-953]|uniref:lipoxygenase family protein n=1 Tax=Hydrocoleum sp. CS-953 TaxID=1671698 RepID=UPI000B9B3F17|nr:lipoxygenase family protein [Hydrocoleum sp. CS-953]OZH51836.1 lipoxygenase [Hydrocoleum sp. CS-953]
MLIERKSSLSPIKLAIFLLRLRQALLFPDKAYKYNYSYLQPLAITDVPENKLIENTLGISFPNLPKGAFPSITWIVKVVYCLITIVVNGYLYKKDNSLDLYQNDWAELTKEVESLDSDISQPKTQKSLQAVIEKLEATLQKISPDLKEKESIFEGVVHGHFREIDNTISQLFGSKKREKSLVFDELSVIDRLENIVKFVAKIAEIVEEKNTEVEVSESLTLDDYNKLYQVIEKPAISNSFTQDLIFAYLQVAGPNPLVVKQFTQMDSRLPVTEEKYKAIAEKFGVTDSLSNALAEGRLYASDYKILESLPNGNYINEDLVQQKYISAPIALFAVPPQGSSSRSLFPVAISYQKTTISEEWVLFTPLDADEPWMSAKNIVQMADSNYHELISHLGRTHLVVEPFIVPTYNLPENHPLRNLLTPHFEGTVLINYGAHSLLVAPGEAVDSLLASNIGADQSLAAKGSQSYLFNFNAINFPQTLVDRGVNNSDTLPIYPYRDDGQLIWDAIYNWVNDYLSIYYTSDDVIVADKDLQDWGATLVSLDGGRVENFGEDSQGQIKTRDYLVKAVSTIIFIGSAQHAAVNFSQKTYMMYVPGFPLARYLMPPTSTEDRESFMQGLPSLSQALEQINTLYLLGSVNHTKLGNYYASAFPENQELQLALNKFKESLNAAATIINQRNQSPERLMPYEFMLPENIPQSINI